MNDDDVKVYALSTCIHCRNAKEYLKQCGVGYTCIDVDKLDEDARKAMLEEVKKLNPSCSFPTIVIGDKVIVGFRKDEIMEVLHL